MKISTHLKFILPFTFLIVALQSGISQDWGQDQKIINPDWESFEEFGYELVFDNNSLYVGVPGGDVNGENAGKVLVFKVSSVDGSLSYDKTIISDDIEEDDHFGVSLDVWQNYLVVGADFEKNEDPQDTFVSGAAYVFKYDSLNREWSQVQKIVAPSRQMIWSRGFGVQVKINQDYIFVSAPEDEKILGQDTISFVGSVYVYKRDSLQEEWVFHQVLEPVNFDLEEFGSSIAANEKTLVVGFPNNFYVYQNESGSAENWNLTFEYENESSFDDFGSSVALKSDNIYVGAISENVNNVSSVGAVHHFKRASDNEWRLEQKIFPSDPNIGMSFGKSISVEDSYLLISAPEKEIVNDEGRRIWLAGEVYIFGLNENGWNERQVITSCDIEERDEFGYAIDSDGSTIYIGAPFEDEVVGKEPPQSSSDNRKGSVYIFKPCSPINTEVIQEEHQLMAMAEDVSYQWVDCNNDNEPVEEAIEQTFEPEVSGTYAVILTADNGCSDTSECYMVSPSSIHDNPFQQSITVYPSPSQGDIHLDLQTIYPRIQMEVTDMHGKTVLMNTYRSVSKIDFTIQTPPGVYTIQLRNEKNEVAVLSVVKE